MTIETQNDFLVGIRGTEVVIQLPAQGVISKDKALRLAAWLVLLSMANRDEFDAVLNAIADS